MRFALRGTDGYASAAAPALDGPRGGAGRDGAGLSLLEFLFATSIIAFVALGVAGMFPAAFRTVVSGGQTTKATLLASGIVETLRAERFDELIPRYDGFDSQEAIPSYSCPVSVPSTDDAYAKMRIKCDLAAAGAQASGQGLPDGGARIAVACVNADGTSNGATPCPTDLRRITVTVRWERQGERSVQLVTDAARRE